MVKNPSNRAPTGRGLQASLDGIQRNVAEVARHASLNDRHAIQHETPVILMARTMDPDTLSSEEVTDYTDERYWVELVNPSPCYYETDQLTAEVNKNFWAHNSGDTYRFTATNLAEIGGHTHSLTKHVIVHVFCALSYVQATGEYVKRYFFNHNFIPGAGDTQYQVLQMVTATTYGWDWVRFHAGA